MPHVRSQLKPVLGNRLKEAVAALEGRAFWRYGDPECFALALQPMPGKAFANLTVATERTVDPGSASGGAALQYRDYDVDVTVFLLESDTVEDDLDAIQVDVEAAFAKPLPVDLHSLLPKGSTLIEFGTTDDGELLGLRISFTARVLTMTGSPDVSVLKGA